MNFRQMSVKQLALIITGLRSIYIEDSEKERQKMIEACETELSTRGYSMSFSDVPVPT